MDYYLSKLKEQIKSIEYLADNLKLCNVECSAHSISASCYYIQDLIDDIDQLSDDYIFTWIECHIRSIHFLAEHLNCDNYGFHKYSISASCIYIMEQINNFLKYRE